MRLRVVNSQRRFRLNLAALRQAAGALALAAQHRLRGGPRWQEVTLHLLDDKGIVPVNAAIMSHAGPTDVVTQRYETIPGEPEGLVGELFVNVECAVRAAPRRAGWSPDRELMLYLAHGFDHLTGADDGTPQERLRMRRRELGWLKRLTLTPLFQTGKL